MSDKANLVRRATGEMKDGRFIPFHIPTKNSVSPNASLEQNKALLNQMADEDDVEAGTDQPKTQKKSEAVPIRAAYYQLYKDIYGSPPYDKKRVTLRNIKGIINAVEGGAEEVKKVAEYAIKNWPALKKEFRFRPMRADMTFVFTFANFTCIRDYMLSGANEKSHTFSNRALENDDDYTPDEDAWK